MEKIKTLKDMKRYYHGDNYATIAEHEIISEVIKIAKPMQQELNKYHYDAETYADFHKFEDRYGMKVRFHQMVGQLHILKTLFNLTKEDLK